MSGQTCASKSQLSFKWSTFVQIYGCWLLADGSRDVFKAEKKVAVSNLSKLKKKYNYFHSNLSKVIILGENSCHF